MSRRITSKTVVKHNRNEAIQPRQGDRIAKLLDSLLEALEIQDTNDHQGMTVFHVSSTKEVKKKGVTVSSRVDHRRETLIVIEHLPQTTAEKEDAGGDRAAQTQKNDHRLVELIWKLLKRVDNLLYNCFLQTFAKEAGKEAAKALRWLIATAALFLLAYCYHILIK